jgi:gliding motility-associated-like protein
LAKPKHIYRLYTLLLGCCCFLTLVSAYGQTVDFTINKRTGCIPLSGVNFTDISSGGGGVVSRDWNLGNGTIIPNGAATVGTNYLTAQTFYVTLTVRFVNGSTLSKLDSVIVYPKPTANFVVDDTAGCIPHFVKFTDLSTTATGTITNWTWDFGAGGSIASNPTFTYNTPGNYNVSLIVKNSWGCESNAATKFQYIHVYTQPVASFTANPSYTCKDTLTVFFTNTTTGGGTTNQYKWYFGDGDSSSLKNPSHFYAAPGVYTVTLKTTIGNKCVSTVTTYYYNSIYVGKPTPSFVIAPDTVCVNTATTFTGTMNPSNTGSYLKWIFYDNNQLHYNSPISHTFATPGDYAVDLIAYNYVGCNDTVKKMVHVKPGPVIDFTADRVNGGCIPFTVNFTNNSVGTNLKFTWNFGDGTPTVITNGQVPISHKYTSFGNFTVTLMGTDTGVANGCTGVKTFSHIRIYRPNVNFTYIPPNGCKPLPVAFTAQITNSIVPIVKYVWDYGDGSMLDTVTIPFGFHLYTNAGVFQAKLTIVLDSCSYTSILKPVTVIDICDDDGSGGGGGGGGFVIGKNCTNKYTVVFTDTVTNAVVQSWDFGDGSPLYTTPPLDPVTYTYSPPQKEYIVTVTRLDTITNSISTGQKKVIIIDEKANFAPNITDICKNKTIQFKTIGMDSSKIKKYTWDFGDGTPKQIIDNALYYSYYGIYLNGNTSHIYLDTGVFYVKLLIEDKLGCKDSLVYPVPISVKGPVVGFSATPLTSCSSPLLVTYADSSKPNGTTPITKWEWTFGDGTPLFTTTQDSLIRHIYTGNSYYNFYWVTLKITDAIGCEATVTKPNYIRIYKPKADFFSYDTLKCGSRNVFLYNYSAAYNANYTWYYGDGTSSVGYYGVHTYTTDGVYDIKLVVVDENGCKDSITKTSYIKIVKPIANFRVGDTTNCAPTAIQFFDSSLYAKSYSWDFGDGGTGSIDKDPAAHIYAIPGLYKVTLKITGPNGCIDSVFKWIRVRGPIGNLTALTGNGCKPYTINMKVTGSFISTYAWDYSDGTPVNANASDSVVFHTYFNAGKYLPNVILTSPEGCPYTLKAMDTVVVDSAKAAFIYGNSKFCDSGYVSFTNLSKAPAFSSLKYKWFFGDGSIDSLLNPASHLYNVPGQYDVKLVVYSQYGCVDSVVKLKAVIVNASPKASIIGDSTICLKPNTVLQYNSFINSVDSIAIYKWKIDGNLVSTDSNLVVNYRTPGNHVLNLFIETKNGCSYTVSRNFVIDSIVSKFNLSPYKFCGAGTVVFNNLTTHYTATNYAWTFGDGITYNGIDTSHTYNLPGSYTVKLLGITSNGCKDSTTYMDTVKVYHKPTASINGNAIICLTPNTTLQYNATIASVDPIANYDWKIDGNTVANTAALNYNYRIPGTHTISLEITTSNGCTHISTKSIIIDSVKTNFNLNPYKLCGAGTVVFNNLTTHYTATNYAWSFGDGITYNGIDTSHNYNLPGIYTVKLLGITSNGCKDSTTYIDTIKVYHKPTASINGNAIICLTPSTTLQYNATIASVDPIANYDWKIDGNTVANTAVLNYDYRVPGVHTISLEIITSNGCNHVSSKIIVIDSVKTNFNLSPYKFCGNGTVLFKNLTTYFTPTNYTWNFGDGSSYNGLDTSHTYTTPGNYTIKLLGISSNGCKDSTVYVDTIKIFNLPKAKIDGDSIHCTPGLKNYIGNIISVDNIGDYKWYVDNVLVSNNNNLTYNFTPGTHTIGLKVFTVNGCTDSLVRRIEIDSAKANFNVNQNKFCGDMATVQFTNTAFAQYPITKYLWLFGDNTISSLPNPIHTYTQYGFYKVSLIITTANGCTDTIVKPDFIEIYKNPIASFTGDAIRCTLGNGIYTSNSTSLNPITQYSWMVNGIAVGTNPILNYNFVTANLYNVALKVTTDKGCSVDSVRQIIVDSVGAKFSIQNPILCGDTGTVRFTNLSASRYGNMTYQWSFGDGQFSTATSPNHFYNGAGTYTVTLTATTANNCSNTIVYTDTVKIYARTTASIIGDTEKCNQSKLVYKANIVTQDAVTFYTWKLNSNTISTADTMVYNFTIAGTYTVELTIGTQFGCTVTTSQQVIIRPLPIPNAAPNTTICNGTSVVLNSYDGTSYSWSPITALQNPNTANPIATPITDTKYYVTVTNQYGCVQKDSVQIVVKQPVNMIVSNNDTLCIGEQVQLQATGNTASYIWTPATGLNNATIANPIAAPTITTNYRVIGYSGTVCKNDTAYINIAVGSVPTVNAGVDLNVAAGTNVLLQATVNQPISNYLWTPSTGLSCTNCPDPQLIANNTITYKVAVETAYGCKATDDITVFVFCSKGKLFIPNAFTPNGDGVNDKFYVQGYGLAKVKRFTIFSRWGDKVFERQNVPVNDPAYGWDGRIKNQLVTTSTAFVYTLELVCIDGQEFFFKGTVVLVQ